MTLLLAVPCWFGVLKMRIFNRWWSDSTDSGCVMQNIKPDKSHAKWIPGYSPTRKLEIHGTFWTPFCTNPNFWHPLISNLLTGNQQKLGIMSWTWLANLWSPVSVAWNRVGRCWLQHCQNFFCERAYSFVVGYDDFFLFYQIPWPSSCWHPSAKLVLLLVVIASL